VSTSTRPPADHVELLDPPAREAPEVVERACQVASEAVEVIDDDHARARDRHALGQVLEALASATAHAIVGDDLGDLPPHGPGHSPRSGRAGPRATSFGPGFLRTANVANGGHHDACPMPRAGIIRR
jgi:hypothetical protein